MPIRVYCNCGRKLIASDDQAGRKTTCPVCGGPVQVPRPGEKRTPREPVLKPSFIAGPEEGEATAKPDLIESQVTIGSHTASPEGTKPRRRRGRSIHWRDSLYTPLDHAVFLMQFGVLGSIAAIICGGVLQSDASGGVFSMRAVGAFLVFGVPTAAVACEFLTHVAAEASRIGGGLHRWVNLVSIDTLDSLARWVLCFLCGPILAMAFATWYWMKCGDVHFLDRIILFEAFALGGGYFAVQILLTSGRPWTGMLPGPVFQAAGRLGWRTAAICAGAGVVGSVCSRLWISAMTASSLDEYWTSFRCWFVLLLAAMAGSCIVLDLAGTWYAQYGEALPKDPPRPKSTLPEMPIPEALPESSTIG